MLRNLHTRGISLLEVIIVSAIITTFFAGLFGGFRYTLELTADTKARQTALSVTLDQIEFIRALAYDNVGTVAGVPAGAIPQTATTTRNEMEFTITTLIEYVDDPADGLGALDVNGITTDYKKAKVTVAWERRGLSRSVSMVTNIIPRSIETDVGGGTIRVNVFDANITPLPGAIVRFINTTVSPAIDTIRTTNAQGTALLGGAPASSGYEIIVSRTGYSTEQTYEVSPALENPNSPHVTVAEADITTLNFFIDRLSSIRIRTVASAVSLVESYDLATTVDVATSSSVVVGSGEVILMTTAGTYAPQGEVVFRAITPVSLSRYERVVVIGTTTPETARVVQIYSASTTPILIPEAILPGNVIGFSTSNIDISSIPVGTYPSLQIGVILQTASPTIAPTVSSISVQYVESETPRPNVVLSVRGQKTIGTTDTSTTVYKYEENIVTDENGEYQLNNIEWDSYRFEPSSFTIASACPSEPLIVPPQTTSNLTLTLVSTPVRSLRVPVTTSAGVAIPDATVTLARAGYSATATTDACGQVFMAGMAEETDFTLTVSAGGYATAVVSDVAVTSNEVIVVQL